MRINFNRPFKGYDGKDAVEEKEVLGENGKKIIKEYPQMMGDLIARWLYNGHGIERTGDAEKDNRNKFNAYKLCQRIVTSSGDIEISPEEAVLIKQVASMSIAGAYAQIVELIDGKEGK